MPLVLRIDRYCVFFWANEGEPLEPVHVHVSKGHPVPHATKIWLLASGLLGLQTERIMKYLFSKLSSDVDELYTAFLQNDARISTIHMTFQ